MLCSRRNSVAGTRRRRHQLHRQYPRSAEGPGDGEQSRLGNHVERSIEVTRRRRRQKNRPFWINNFHRTIQCGDCLFQVVKIWRMLFQNSSEMISYDLKKELSIGNGFTFNTLRNTVNFFSCGALMAFLSRNNLSHVVRAHEVQHSGFKVMQCDSLLYS